MGRPSAGLHGGSLLLPIERMYRLEQCVVGPVPSLPAPWEGGMILEVGRHLGKRPAGEDHPPELSCGQGLGRIPIVSLSG